MPPWQKTPSEGRTVARTVPRVARYTWARHWPAAALEGAVFGVAGLASFVVKRSLGAPEEIVPLTPWRSRTSRIAARFLYGRIKWQRSRQTRRRIVVDSHPWRATRDVWREMFSILGKDRAFRAYEIGFMLYGAGFLCSVGLLVLYAEAELSLSYDQWTSAQFLAFPMAQIAGAAIFGRLADRIGILRGPAVAFALLALFFGLMPFVSASGGLVAACAVWGIAMAGVSVGWSLGPLHFAPDGKAHMYSAVHFSMVGVRSIFAPFLGFAVKEMFSYPVAFGLSVVLVSMGAVALWRLARRSA